MTVLGVDAYKRGWVAVALDDHGFVGAFVAPHIAAIEAEASERWGVEVIVIDVPIGVPDVGPRQADSLARAFLGSRASSVFSTPNRAALAAPDRASADAASRSVGGQGVSAQAFAIRDRILEVNGHLPRARARLLEGHPEVSFREMARPAGDDAGTNGGPLPHGKASAAGLMLRADLLAAAGIAIPRSAHDALGTAALDDVYDAAAMAWTARRVAAGRARALPDGGEVFGDGVASAIWY